MVEEHRVDATHRAMRNNEMRFFTREWLDGDLSEEETEARARDYYLHVEGIAPALSGSVLALARRVNLHDAKVLGVVLGEAEEQLHLKLVCGDKLHGYEVVELGYAGVCFETSDFRMLEGIAANPKTEVLRDEVDLEGERFVHRLIFWPSGEIKIVFASLDLRRREVPDRRVTKD